MAHFAQVVNGKVTQVIVVSNDDCPDPAPDNEAQGRAFLASLGFDGLWVQCSYHASFRAHYPGAGFIWDEDADAFYEPQPFPSWTLNDDYRWVAPVPYPTDGGPYSWDEEEQVWQLAE
jgi:hypothetical protein